jgi:hypothetical protein
VHPTLGILAQFQAFFYASAFSQSDGVPPPAPARVTQTVVRYFARQTITYKGIRMRHYLARTSLYGVGAGLFLLPLVTGAFDESASIWFSFFILFFLIIIIFLITEILPRKNSETLRWIRVFRVEKGLAVNDN